MVFEYIFENKAPEPVDSWKPHVLDAFEHGNICIQPPITVTDLPFPQSEDCLTLNIYVPGAYFQDFKRPNLKLCLNFIFKRFIDF